MKQGKTSCGVGRQYTGPAGKITNCQIGVFAAYASCHGHAFIDRALYLPKSWTDDTPRLAAAHVPAGTGFATKPQLAARMIARAIAALAPADWQRLSAGAGTKGPRLRDWCHRELADLEVEAETDANHGQWTRGLLIRRHIADGELAFFSTWCPAGTNIETLVAVEGHRWSIEDSFEAAKNELGLDHNETRSCHGWHRHVSLVMLAFAMMATIRHHANQPLPKKTKIQPATNRLLSSAGRSRKSAG